MIENKKIKNFIEENIDLLIEDSRESWEEIYKKLASGYDNFDVGDFTDVMLEAGINPLDENRLDYIPKSFLYCSKIPGEFIIPNYIKGIGDWAFADCSSLTGTAIPDSVTSIGKGAFYSCSGLTSVTIGNGVTSIGSSAFYNCSGLTNITIPDSVTSIGSMAFSNCSSLTNITISDSVKSMGDYAFSDCSDLTSVAVEDGATHIGYGAFDNCICLVSVTIPDSITHIGYGAFEDCDNLKDIYYNGTKELWQKISKNRWILKNIDVTIHCTDGKLIEK